MKVVTFEKFCVIRNVSPRDSTGEMLCIHMDVPDGTPIVLTRASDGKYAYGKATDGRCSFDQSFILRPDVYTLEFKASNGIQMSCRFKAEKRGLAPLYMSYESEVQKMWDAICSLKEIVKTEEEKIDTVIDGYVTE